MKRSIMPALLTPRGGRPTPLRILAALVAALLIVVLVPAAATAQPPARTAPAGVDGAAPAPPAPPPAPPVVAPGRRAEVLGPGWERSGDRVWTVTGDADGLHVLVAEAAAGYAWRTAATLAEPGFDADAWIGTGCVTGSGRRLVVVYAPRTFTNEEALSHRGGFTAVVDLVSGAVTKLAVQTSLAYFNPGCGADESAVLTQEGTGRLAKTRVLRLDAAAGRLAAPIEIPGQLTSAVPLRDGIAAADATRVVRVDATGGRTLLASTSGVPFRLTPDAEGGVVFLDPADERRVAVRRVAAGPAPRPVTLATGQLHGLGLARGAGGRVFVTGAAETVAALPKPVTRVNVPDDAEVSTVGEFAITGVQRADHADPREPVADPTQAEPVQVQAVSVRTGKPVSFTVDPAARLAPAADTGRVTSPALTDTAPPRATTSASPTDPVDTDRWCSVPRNDLGNQAYQPKPRQVEWAVDQAVRGVLTVARPANWKNLGMPAYTPQGLFPRPALAGGGDVPAQIMLGIAAQESNLWQASRHALPGVTGNPLVGNFYGRAIYDTNPADDWDIHWAESDCGYGVMQITDRMRMAGHEKQGELPAYPYPTQRAVALDFAVNVALGLRMLVEKWNALHQDGMLINGGNPAYIENWFFAVWAYNSGYYSFNEHGDGAWGVGWANNPANPRYLPAREPFLEYTYQDAAHPQHWPYQEKVIGWAGHPIESLESPNTHVAGFRAAWWTSVAERVDAKPIPQRFCNGHNECDMEGLYDNDLGEPAGPCMRRDLKCWYHLPVTWKANCAQQCGNELLRFDPGYPYQDDGVSYPPNCALTGLPAGALVIDDVPDNAPVVRPGCGHPWANAGTFGLNFADTGGLYSSKVDFHQIGAGFGGHFWFAHSWKSNALGNRMRVTGTWRLNNPLNGWSRVLVHLPDHGAHSQQARYDIQLGNGVTRSRYLNQQRQANNWVSLGVYPFSGSVGQAVTLSNVNPLEGRGEADLAWDAIAFQPLPGKPRHVVAVLGDSYISGEGLGSYYQESDINHGTPEWNACRRSRNAWPRKLVLPGVSQDLGTLADGFSTDAELGFVACSGAQTWNVRGNGYPISWDNPNNVPAGEGQFREISQLSSGAVNEDTTLVLLSIGGNDENAFAGAALACLWDCDAGTLNEYQAIVDRTQLRIAATARQIQDAAPHAKIVLVGYPELADPTRPCGPFGEGSLLTLSRLARYMSAAQEQTVRNLYETEGLEISFLTSYGWFEGHRACDAAPWLNAVVTGPHGDGDFHAGDQPVPFCFWEYLGDACLSRESFHPNASSPSGWAARIAQFLPRGL